MKKTTTLSFCTSLLLLSFSSVFAQDVTITNAQFKAILVDNPDINTNGDSEIQVSEASAYNGGIYLSNSLITDMTGLEYFTSITELQCGSNNLTSLDVSANTALRVLHCEQNHLTSLDLSHNLALEEVRFFINDVTSIDVSVNTALTFFDCAINQITELDLSANTALTMLDCFSNHLTTLDLSNNGSLVHVMCGGPQLESLNLQNGHNELIDPVQFAINYSPQLFCVEVDDPAYSTANWFNRDSIVIFSLDCTGGLEEPQMISASPNPFSHSISIQSLENISMIEIKSLSGTTVSTIECSGMTTTIPTDHLMQGIYFCKIYMESGTISSARIFKETE